MQTIIAVSFCNQRTFVLQFDILCSLLFWSFSGYYIYLLQISSTNRVIYKMYYVEIHSTVKLCILVNVFYLLCRTENILRDLVFYHINDDYQMLWSSNISIYYVGQVFLCWSYQGCNTASYFLKVCVNMYL